MTNQLALVNVAAVPVLRGQNQQVAWDLIRSTPGGVTADEIGALIHAHRTDRWRHSVDERCLYCATAGLSVVKTKALAALVVRRRKSGKYEPREVTHRAAGPSTQLLELPGVSFQDIFRKETA